MSELSKNQLTQENNNSFPNNNTGYITPTLLRTFNQNMIDSMVDEIQYNVESASFNQRINVLDPSGSAQAITSLQIATASLNAYTQSQNSFNSSATASIVALQNFSSSLDATFATDAQLSASVSALSASVAVTDLSQSSSIAALQQFSSSLDTTFATDAQLSASASTLQNSINTKLDSASFNSYTASQSSNITASLGSYLLTSSFNTYTESAASGVSASINTATSSLSQSLSASIGSLSASVAVTTNLLDLEVNQKLDSSSFNIYTSSTEQSLSQLNSVSQSATTGSNTFIGNQIVSGNVNIAGNITAVSASFTYVTTIFETASVIFSSGSNQFGDELSDVQTLSGSVRVQGGLTVNGVPVQTSSFDASGYLLTSSFNQYTQSESANVTSSISALSSSIAVTTNNLDLEVNGKLDSSSFNTYTQSNDIKVNALIAATGSYAISSSVANTFDAFSSSISLTYATKTELSASASTLQNGINSKVENSTFNTYTSSQNTINQGLQTGITIRLLTSSFNTYTSSNDSKVNSLISATGSYITSAQTSSMTVLSSSFSQTASFALNVTPTDVTPFLSKSVFDTYTGSAALGVSESINSATQSLSSSIATTTNNLDLEVNGKLDSSSFNSYTQSNNSIVNGKLDSSSFNSYTQSNDNIVNEKLNTSSFNSYTQSNDSVVNALVAATSSYVTEAETGSFITSAQTSSMSVLSSSYSVTASFALNVPATSSFSISSSFAQTASIARNVVVNATNGNASTLNKGTVVRITGANGDNPIFNSASWDNDGTSANTLGILQSSVVSGATGSIVVTGVVIGVDTDAFSAGDVLYLSSSGQFTNVQPQAPRHIVTLGEVLRVQQNNGSIFVNISNGWELDELHNVRITNPAQGNLLAYNSASRLWENSSSVQLGFATTGSNTFIGNQIINGNISASGAITASSLRALSASITYLETIYQTSSVVYSSGSNILGDELTDTQTLSGSVLVQGLLRVNGVAPILVGQTASFASASISSSFAQTASFALNVTPTDVSMFVSQSTFNSYTSSNDGKVNSLIAATSSYAISSSVASITSASQGQINSLINATSSYITSTGSFATTGSNTFVGNQIISGNLLVSGANINLEVDAPALSVGVTNVKTVLDATASGVITSEDIYRTGAGPTGDLSGIRLQTLSGSDTTGDTLLSRITTGINRHTSTAMTGSTVNTTISSTWATGSGGTRVAYQTSINANAQSASATLTLNAGNLASNNVGGTASIAAGLIRIGTNAAHNISLTGSIVGGIIMTGSSATGTPMLRIAGSGSNGNALEIYTGSVQITTPQGDGFFYSNVPITSSGLRINGTALVGDLIVSGAFGANSSVNVIGALTASVISASQYIGIIQSASFAINAGTAQTASFVQGLAPQVATLGYAITGSNRFNGNQTITGSLNVSASIGGDLGNFINGGVTIVGDNTGIAVAIKSGSFELTSPQGTGYFYTNLPITSSHARFNGQSYIKRLNIEDNAGDANLQVENNVSVSGSLTVVGPITGSIVSSSFAQTASFALNASIPAGTVSSSAQITAFGFAITGSNRFVGNQTITGSVILSSSADIELTVIGNTVNSGSTILSGSVVISGSAPVQQWVSGGLTLSGSLLTNATDIYTGSNNANFVVTLGSASMATLIAGGTTNPNTLYFVI
jgi:hypothetical protein